MRNSMLIRQWSILRGIADGDYGVSLDLEILAKIFSVSTKTVSRDIKCLRYAGFLISVKYKTPENTIKYANDIRLSRVKERRRLAPIPELKQLVNKIENLAEPETLPKAYSICNICRTYKFKKLENNKIDMDDFRSHKEACASLKKK